MPTIAELDIPFVEEIALDGAFVPIEILWSANSAGHGATSTAGGDPLPSSGSVGDDGPSDAIWVEASKVAPGVLPVGKVVAPTATNTKMQSALVCIVAAAVSWAALTSSIASQKTKRKPSGMCCNPQCRCTYTRLT